MTSEEAAKAIEHECDSIKEMLLAKNKAYGNSALEPMRVFSKAPPTEQIRIRLDDKLSRLARGEAAGEDVILDLIGYLVLLRISSGLGTNSPLGKVKNGQTMLEVLSSTSAGCGNCGWEGVQGDVINHGGVWHCPTCDFHSHLVLGKLEND